MNKKCLSVTISLVIKMIKAVFIDIDDTLLDFSKCAEYSMSESFKDFGLQFEKFMFPVFEEINAGLWHRLEKSEITKSDLYGKRWFTVLGEFGITNIDGYEFEKHFQKHISESAEKVDGAKDLLAYLSSKYKIYAASNGPQEQQIKRLKKAKLLEYFTDVFTSELLGVQKPESAFFDNCFGNLDNIRPEEAVLIGDSLHADISGGIKYNMTTIWFNKKNSGKAENILPDFTVNSLTEIKNIL